jgi:hypothetical protein
MEDLFMLMVIIIVVNGQMTKHMASDIIFMLTALRIEENGKKINGMGRELKLGKMEFVIKGTMFKKNKDGFGVFEWADGSKYIGAFINTTRIN